MKKASQLFYSLLLFAVLFFSQTVFAQTSSFAFAHAIGGVPVDQSTSKKYNAGLGLEAGYAIGLRTTYFTITAGYISLLGKSIDSIPGSYKSEGYIPVKIGFRQYFTREKVFFFNADLGGGFISNSYPTPKTPNPSSTRLAGDLGFGVALTDFEFGAAFDFFQEPSPDGTSGLIELKAGWNFDLSKK